jgi:G3E family GTPase
MNSAANSTGAARPPVTVLCGFLGAGKTTLLNHLLGQANGRRWAVVVNDVAAINIDAAVVRAADDTRASRDIVELGNGCVCCSSKDELAETIAELAATAGEKGYAHILVETTGVAEPRGIGNLFTPKNPFGRSLGDFATLSALVSVIDAVDFLRRWRADRARSEGREVLTGEPRPVFELMLEQVECADVLVLNKCDLVSADERIELEALVHGLNARAEVVCAEWSGVDAGWLLGRVRFEAKGTLRSATWLRSLTAALPAPAGSGPVVGSSLAWPRRTAGRPRHEARFGIGSFVFQARRPFAAGKFFALIERRMPGLLRAKGYFWTQERPDEMGFLSVAGGAARYDFLSYWWAAMIENGRVRHEHRPDLVVALWQEPHGDRRQELVFIGVGLDEPALRAELEACLVQDRGGTASAC